MATEIVVFVPGIMGSELYDGKKCIWPGSAIELLLPYSHMASLMKPALTVGDIIRRVLVVSQYDDLVGSLKQCGFDEKANPQTLYVVPYDWRKDNALAVAQLADLVDRVATTPGGADITLLGHSMGGLICRSYLESGLHAARPGFASIRRLITLATPHRGAPIAMSGALAGEKHLFLSAAQTRQLASDPQFPALYQLFPPRGEPFVWDQDPAARFAPVDVYAPAIAARMQLVVANLQSAEKFHKTLDLARRPAAVAYFFFVGTQHETMSEFQASIAGAGTVKPRAIHREDGGDGTVPVWSGGLTQVQSAAVSGEHGSIYKANDLLTVLGTLLGKQGVLAALPQAQVSVRDRVVETGGDTRAVVSFASPANAIEGELRVSRLTDTQGAVLTAPTAVSVLEIDYKGAPVDRLSIQLEAPQYPGAYRVAFVAEGDATASASDDFIVQQA